MLLGEGPRAEGLKWGPGEPDQGPAGAAPRGWVCSRARRLYGARFTVPQPPALGEGRQAL